MRHDTTVAIVGAGLSGLTAARTLFQAGIDVTVLESADRPGGRALAETTALGSRVDLGGQWLGHNHHRLAGLADELGLTRYPMHSRKLPAILDGHRRIRAASPSMLTAAAALAGVAAVSRIKAPPRWNDVSVAEWLRRVPGRVPRRLLEVLALISWTADLERMSVAAMAQMLRHQGGLRTVLATRGGAQDSLLVEGVGTIVERLAAELGPALRTGCRVTAMMRDEQGVLLRTAAGEVRARRAIVTVPPPLARHITHEPPLPPARVALERDTYMGSVYKALAVYPMPFWRARGAGDAIVLDKPGRAVFDTTAPGGPGHLCFLIAGPEARELDGLAADARRRLLLFPLADLYGPGVLDPADWREKFWHRDEHAGGGYIALPDLGGAAGFPPMPATPVGSVHWAGAETAHDHPGYLDGAIEAGERAAREVIKLG